MLGGFCEVDVVALVLAPARVDARDDEGREAMRAHERVSMLSVRVRVVELHSRSVDEEIDSG